ncbi:MAG: carbamate kinase [Candidatus Diapherotrites archaeon]|nr:carbamate kinase [Candidatus Diapherotrites archaeon]
MKTLVLALGGNALIHEGQLGMYAQQQTNVQNALACIPSLVRNGWHVVITHGNGPHVGNLQLQEQALHGKIPEMPLYVDGAMTQGQIGFMIQQALSIQLGKPVPALLTRVQVSARDPAFRHPSKPIGPYYSKKPPRGAFTHVPKKGWRKTVASPLPQKILELNAIQTLLKKEQVVICGGGGGIPVVKKGKKWKGVEAVIDKDLASQVLATALNAQKLVIATNVDFAKLHYETPWEENIVRAKAKGLECLLACKAFEEGSMAPKIRACIAFVEQGQGHAIICHTNQIEKALKGLAGTHITR